MSRTLFIIHTLFYLFNFVYLTQMVLLHYTFSYIVDYILQLMA